MKKYLINAGIVIGLMATVSCSNDAETKTEEQILAESNTKPAVQINRAVFDEMIQSLPQPIEIANIITKSQMPFSKEMLVPSSNSDKYIDKYYQSMAFGAYGVDLGYINLNDKKYMLLNI